MDIRYRLYPHPVLINDTDDYVNSCFDFKVEVKKRIREINLNFQMNLNNEEMESLIRKGDLEFLVHIECPITSYREVITTDQNSFSKNISESCLNGKVAICAFIVSNKDLIGYKNNDFNTDYEGMSFSIDRGSILAVGGQLDLNIVKEAEELTKIPSIFTICKYASSEDESMKIELDCDKISIGLSEKCFNNYKMLVNMHSFLPVLHSMIILPVLIYVFETLKRQNIEEYENRRWFIAIKKTLAKNNFTLDDDSLANNESYELAQKLLDLPLNRALNALTSFEDSEDYD